MLNRDEIVQKLSDTSERWDLIIIGGGATGGGSDAVFYENDQTVTTNYTITSNQNAMAAGVITINSGVVLTVPSGARLVVV